MEPIAKERDRLLNRSTRALGIAFTVVAFIALSVPGVVDGTALFAMYVLGAGLVASLWVLGSRPHLAWVVTGLACGIGILLLPHLPFLEPSASSLPVALAPLTAGALASYAIVLTHTPARLALLGVAFASAATLIELVSAPGGFLSLATQMTIVGWILTSLLGLWLSASVPRAARRIFSIGRAHRAERHASETEAQRRQSARLLHDTVLATLTLLAHSGVGVAPDVLRQQAAEDARLLRQLRLGTDNGASEGEAPANHAGETLVAVSTEHLGTTLESVKKRFSRVGLEVSWHGTGQVLLEHAVLDAFLLALAECLENVRRHSGVTNAHVTITDDATTVRAMVTDSGVGFNVGDIDEASLGLKESVMGRLTEVGGNARLFSSPGSGTTVVLEVPK